MPTTQTLIDRVAAALANERAAEDVATINDPDTYAAVGRARVQTDEALVQLSESAREVAA